MDNGISAFMSGYVAMGVVHVASPQRIEFLQAFSGDLIGKKVRRVHWWRALNTACSFLAGLASHVTNILWWTQHTHAHTRTHTRARTHTHTHRAEKCPQHL